MPATSREPAILLRRHRYGESSLVVRALARSGQRVSVIAKGAYRPKSAYYGVLDLFDTLELEWSESPRSELGSLRAARPLVLRRALSRDLGRYRAALAAVELADLAARPGAPEPRLYEILERALDRMAGPGEPGVALVAFEMRFLRVLGLFPALDTCASCGAPPETRGERATFSAGAGGRLCARCATDAREAGRRVGTLPRGVLRTAASLAAADDDALARARLAPRDLAAARDFAERFLEYHLETRPRSWRGGALDRAGRVARTAPRGSAPATSSAPAPSSAPRRSSASPR